MLNLFKKTVKHSMIYDNEMKDYIKFMDKKYAVKIIYHKGINDDMMDIIGYKSSVDSAVAYHKSTNG